MRSGKSKWLTEMLTKVCVDPNPIDGMAADLNAVHPAAASSLAPPRVAVESPMSVATQTNKRAGLSLALVCIAAAVTAAIFTIGPDWLWGSAALPAIMARSVYLRATQPRLPE